MWCVLSCGRVSLPHWYCKMDDIGRSNMGHHAHTDEEAAHSFPIPGWQRLERGQVTPRPNHCLLNSAHSLFIRMHPTTCTWRRSSSFQYGKTQLTHTPMFGFPNNVPWCMAVRSVVSVGCVFLHRKTVPKLKWPSQTCVDSHRHLLSMWMYSTLLLN